MIVPFLIPCEVCGEPVLAKSKLKRKCKSCIKKRRNEYNKKYNKDVRDGKREVQTKDIPVPVPDIKADDDYVPDDAPTPRKIPRISKGDYLELDKGHGLVPKYDILAGKVMQVTSHGFLLKNHKGRKNFFMFKYFTTGIMVIKQHRRSKDDRVHK